MLKVNYTILKKTAEINKLTKHDLWKIKFQ